MDSRENQCRGYRLGIGLNRSCSFHDPGACTLLRRNGEGQERPRHVDAELLLNGSNYNPVGSDWLLARIWWNRAMDRQLRFCMAAQCAPCCAPWSSTNNSPGIVYDLPNDVCCYHPGAYNGCNCRPHAFLGVGNLPWSMGSACLLTCCSLGIRTCWVVV
ncbi:unannotated protein [freshwater metagenome]|uniref:Unannotated protein n=1 Tax=freshwater metagenome TaxID=449393 RepID=A0A6J6LCE0_9ZZZZ